MSLPAAADGPVAYFPFNGSTEDASGFGNHAVSVGAVPTEDRFGNPASAYLVGSFGHLEAADSDSLDTSDAVTLAAWFRPDDMLTDFGVLAGKGMSTGYSFSVYYGGSWVCPDPAAERGIQVTVGGCAIRFSDGPFFDCGAGEWHHVTVAIGAHSGGNSPVSLYVDGSFIETRSIGCALSSNTAPLGIGKDGETQHRFAGAIDDLRVYDRELTADEVTEVYDSLLVDGFESGSASAWTVLVPRCGDLTELQCMNSAECTFTSGYECRPAEGPCESGFRQSIDGPESCEAKENCSYLPGYCYCPPGMWCFCGGGPPPGCWDS
jgi:hypothetical protein